MSLRAVGSVERRASEGGYSALHALETCTANSENRPAIGNGIFFYSFEFFFKSLDPPFGL
jgi:hypothetical protein